MTTTTAGDLFADAINPAARYRSVLFDPTLEDFHEPALTFESLRNHAGLQWPRPEFSHHQFMADRNHAGWLAWQLTRPLDVSSPSGKKAARRWRDAERRATRKATKAAAPELSLVEQLDADKARDAAASIRALVDPMTGRNKQ